MKIKTSIFIVFFQVGIRYSQFFSYKKEAIKINSTKKMMKSILFAKNCLSFCNLRSVYIYKTNPLLVETIKQS